MKICVYLPKREELSLRTVLAFPKDSNSGVASRIWCTITQLLTPAAFTGRTFVSGAEAKGFLPLSDGRPLKTQERIT